jgi:hypothetical protein
MPANATTRGLLQTLPITSAPTDSGSDVQTQLIEGLVRQVADRVATAIIERLQPTTGGDDDWLDSRNAAEYLVS